MRNIIIAFVLFTLLLGCDDERKKSEGKWSLKKGSGNSEVVEYIYLGTTNTAFRISYQEGNVALDIIVDDARISDFEKGQTIDVEGSKISIVIPSNRENTQAMGIYQRLKSKHKTPSK